MGGEDGRKGGGREERGLGLRKGRSDEEEEEETGGFLPRKNGRMGFFGNPCILRYHQRERLILLKYYHQIPVRCTVKKCIKHFSNSSSKVLIYSNPPNLLCKL